jgi:hypothetical protein
MHRKTYPTLLAALCCAQTAWAASIVVGNHNLLPNTPGQEIGIFITGGDPIQALNFRVLLGDGGPVLGGDDDGPSISGSIYGPGMIFEHNHSAFSNQSIPPFFVDLQTLVIGQTSLAAEGLLGSVIVNTTGKYSGSWTLTMSEEGGFANTGLQGAGTTLAFGSDVIEVDILDGSITIVPEPSSLVLLGFFGIGLASYARRVRKRKT